MNGKYTLELDNENNFQFLSEQEKVKFRNARHQHVLLTKGNKDRVVEVAELSEKCNQTMMLKFGRIVDIDSLELVTTSRAVEEARESGELFEN